MLSITELYTRNSKSASVCYCGHGISAVLGQDSVEYSEKRTSPSSSSSLSAAAAAAAGAITTAVTTEC